MNKHIGQFIRSGKTPRVSMEKLTWDYKLGGLRLPNLQKHYLAAQIRLVSFLFERENVPPWVSIGMYALKENVPADFIYKWTPTTISRRTDNPVLTHVIKMWHEVQKNIGLKNIFSPKTSLKQNELIPMSVDNKILETWHQKGIRHLEDCYKDGCLMSFEDLRRKYDLSSRNFFCYLQLRSFLKSALGPEMTLPMLGDLERLLHEGNTPRLISKVYSLLMDNAPKPGLHKSREKWESDLGVTIGTELWAELCQKSLTATLNSRYRLTYYNFLHQTYLTPQKLHKYKPEISNLCFRWNIEEGSFLHCTWLCTKLNTFWHDFSDIIRKLLGLHLPIDPQTCLLGDTTNIDARLRKAQKRFLSLALCVARKCIAIMWKSDSQLSIGRWVSEMKSCAPLEKITYTLRNDYNTFTEMWQPYLAYMDTLPASMVDGL